MYDLLFIALISSVEVFAGLSPTQASQMHREKLSFANNFTDIANNSKNPSHEAVKYLCRTWTKSEMGGFDFTSIEESIKRYETHHPEVILR